MSDANPVIPLAQNPTFAAASNSSEASTVIAAAITEKPSTVIGRYKLLELIGEGGFGSVFMAEQREPVKRRVALKIIKLGMDTRQVIARFEAERQALAMMDHPNIAKVLDAGATDTGRPYFVMELVRGVPILEYCDTEKLDTKSRLELFISVCNAIQHAHQKGIIHRDIKPSNVLVTLHDGKPVVKVIDFGIAKATNFELTERTLFTQHRQMIGTPAYMSPEQAEMSGLDIDTRSDVYSLGVLLYELLTGTTPFDTKELLEKGYAEMMRIIREVEPHKPSTRLSTLGDTATRTAQLRHTDIRKLGAILRGDLDWIVMKCLEKDRSRRYDTANALAVDVQNHLSGEPVVAAPPSAAYRLRKFVRRNWIRPGFVAGAAVAFILVAVPVATITVGVVAAMYANGRELAQSNEEVAILRAESLEAAILASENRIQTKAEQVRELLVFMLDDLQPMIETLEGADDAKLLVAQKVASFLENSRTGAEQDSEVLLQIAQGYWEVGQVYAGRRDATMEQWNQALDMYARAIGANSDFLQTKPDDPRALRQLSVFHAGRGDAYHKKGDPQRAGEEWDEALRIARKVYDANPKDVRSRRHLANATLNVGAKFRLAGQHALARRHYQESVEIREQLARESPDEDTYQRDLAVGYLRLAGVLEDLNELPESKTFYVRSLAIRSALHSKVEQTLGSKHPETNRYTRDRAIGHLFLGEVNRKMGDTPAAIDNLQIYVDLTEDLASSNPFDARAQSDLEVAYKTIGTVLSLTNDTTRTLADYERMHAWFERRLAGDPQNAERTRRVAASFETMANFIAEHQPQQNARAIELMKSAIEVSRPMTVNAQFQQPLMDLARQLSRLGVLQQRAGQTDAARASLNEALQIYTDISAANSEDADLQAAYNACVQDLQALDQPPRH